MNDPVLSDQQLTQLLIHGFNDTPYHQSLGLVFSLNEGKFVTGTFSKQERLLGNVRRNMIHGGVLTGVFDALGGVICSVALVEKYKHLGMEKGARKLQRLCTIDLRTDFIAPAKGQTFEAKGEIINLGSSIILVDMFMYDDSEKLIAKASATYMA